MSHPYFLFSLVVLLAVNCCVAPPVTEKKKEAASEENEIPSKDEGFGVEYERYLQEVVQALESDPQFREKLQKAEDTDIRSGKIAHELEFVNHAIRTRLDEVKRTELERLRHYARKAFELQQGLDTDHLKIHPLLETDHIDHSNPHTFEVEDLKRLIAKTTKDLAEADVKRREEFKAYEMQKEFEIHEKMKNMSEEDKKKYEDDVHEMKEKHKKHVPLHHPGSKQQLEEVWEKTDHMENQDFDPKTFFYLHDLDGNGFWDPDEVKALFLKELDKMYQASAPEDDMKERIEEMERMREHVFSEADTNHDGLISFEEFLAQTQKPDFNADPGWEGLDQQTVYTPDEYHQFELRRQQEIEAMIADGRLPPHPAQGLHPPPPGMQHHPNAGYPGNAAHPQQYGGHPQQNQEHQQYPQGHPQQHLQQGGHPQQIQQGYPQLQGHQQFQTGQYPQQSQPGLHPQQLQPGQQPQQFQPGQHPQQFQPGQHPQQFQPGQHPQQFQPGQHPQQFQSGQHPQQSNNLQQTESQVPAQVNPHSNDALNKPSLLSNVQPAASPQDVNVAGQQQVNPGSNQGQVESAAVKQV